MKAHTPVSSSPTCLIEAIGVIETTRDLIRRVGGDEYFFMYKGLFVASAHKVSDTIMAIVTRDRGASKMIFLHQPSFTQENTGELTGHCLVPSGSELNNHEYAPSISDIVPGKWVMLSYHDLKKEYIVVEKTGLRLANLDEKGNIIKYITIRNNLPQYKVKRLNGATEIENNPQLIKCSGIIGIDKREYSNGVFLQKVGEETDTTGQRAVTYEEVTLKTADGVKVIEIDKKNVYDIFGGVAKVLLENGEGCFVSTSLEQGNVVTKTQFRCKNNNKQEEDLFPHAMGIPKEGDIFILWVTDSPNAVGKPRYFRGKHSDELVEVEHVRCLDPHSAVYFGSTIYEVDTKTGKKILNVETNSTTISGEVSNKVERLVE